MKKDLIEKELKLTKHQKKLKEFHEKMEYENITSNYNRARAITIGTAFGGTTEIMVRGDGGRHLWLTMQPVEVIELIHQLASNVGCHLAIKPREDFSSWRDWKVTEQEKLHYNGWAPFVNDMAPHQQIGANMEKFENEKQLLKLKQIENEQIKSKIDSLKEQKSEIEKLSNEDKVKLYDSMVNEVVNQLEGSPSFKFENGELFLNKTEIKDNFIHMFGGPGGKALTEVQVEEADRLIKEINDIIFEESNSDETLATKKTVNKRKPKRSSTST